MYEKWRSPGGSYLLHVPSSVPLKTGISNYPGSIYQETGAIFKMALINGGPEAKRVPIMHLDLCFASGGMRSLCPNE